MDRDERANAIEARADRARHHPCGEVVAEVTLGKEHEIEADIIRGQQQVYAEVELGIETSARQRRQRFGDALGHFRRTDSRHRNRRVETKLHIDDLPELRLSPRATRPRATCDRALA
jgi:hypothetical protein